MAFVNQTPVYMQFAPVQAPAPPYTHHAPPPVHTFPQAPVYAPAAAPPPAPSAPLKLRIEYNNGLVYVGEVLYINPNQPVPHGKGTKWWSTGERYEGQFWNDQFHGYGEYYLPNGDYYKGNWEHGKKHGLGESYRQVNQRKYFGNHKDGCETGTACLTVVHPDYEGGPKRYDGQFVNGVRHGWGRLRVRCPDGTNAWFEGQWVNGLLHGPVIFTYHNVNSTRHYVNGVARRYGEDEGWRQPSNGWGMTPPYNYQGGIVAH
jgi:hypothetical protein